MGTYPGGGLLSLEKGTNCGPTSQELSRAKMATKEGGCPVVISSQRGAVIGLIVGVVHQITIIIVLIIHKDSHKYTLVG